MSPPPVSPGSAIRQLSCSRSRSKPSSCPEKMHLGLRTAPGPWWTPPGQSEISFVAAHLGQLYRRPFAGWSQLATAVQGEHPHPDPTKHLSNPANTFLAHRASIYTTS